MSVAEITDQLALDVGWVEATKPNICMIGRSPTAPPFDLMLHCLAIEIEEARANDHSLLPHHIDGQRLAWQWAAPPISQF